MLRWLFTGETENEKKLRLELNDLKNELGEIKAKQTGLPFISTRYEDDDRPKRQCDDYQKYRDKVKNGL